MQQTSLDAYNSLTEDKISERQRQVFEALQVIFPATNRQVSDYSGIPINVVTPRMGELRKKGLVEEAYVGFDVSNRPALYWKPKGANNG